MASRGDPQASQSNALLQVQGWVVIPNSRKADTMGFEYVLINRASHAQAVVQVKTGETPLDRSK